MSKENQKLKYCIYARKSTEDEGRQVQSIDDQINFLTKKAKDLGLNIVEIFKESKSAKDPDVRVEFYKMFTLLFNSYNPGIFSAVKFPLPSLSYYIFHD